MAKPYTAEEVAELFGVHVQTVYRWVREAEDGTRPSPVPFLRLGRKVAFPRPRINALLACEDMSA